MKNLKKLPVLLLSFLLFSAFGIGVQPTQKGADKAIRQHIANVNASPFGSKFSVTEVLSIDPVVLLSENTAKSDVSAIGLVRNSGVDSFPIACTHIEAKLKMEFIFEKKTGNKWVLTGLSKFASKRKVSSEYMQGYHKQSTGLNIAAE